MRRFHARIVHCIVFAVLVTSLSGPAAIAQRESTTGVCHVDPESGQVVYLDTAGPDSETHQRHGDTLAPNGPDDCLAAQVPESMEDGDTSQSIMEPEAGEDPGASVQATREGEETRRSVPEAQDDEYTAEIGVPLVVPPPGVLSNDQGATTATLVREPSFGALDFGRDGSFTYTADREHPGTDVFAYEAGNEYGEIDLGEVFIYLPSGVNSPPVAIDDYFLLQGAAPFLVPAPGVLVNDYDPDGDPISLVGFGTGAKGATTPQSSPDGGFTFIPVSGVGGQYPFTTVITDGLETAQSTLTLDVQLDPNSPVAQIDFYTAPATSLFSVEAAMGVLANDSSPLGSGLSVMLYQGYPSAAITVNADGSFSVGIPGGATSGTHVGFWYQLTDSQGRAVLPQVSITFQ